MAKIRNTRFPQRKSSSPPLVPTIPIMVAFGMMIFIAIKILSFSGDSGGSHKANDLSSLMRDSVDRQSGVGGGNEGRGAQWVELFSWETRAFVYHNFLGAYQLGTFLTIGQDTVVRDIEKRIADFTFIPVEHGEGLQILHYEVGQKYEPHFDYFNDEHNTRNGGQRIATVIMYLSDVEEGGETVFPQAKGNISSVSWWNELSECGKGGLSVKPKMGDALLFWSLKPDTILDESSLHVVALLSRVTNGRRQNGCESMSTNRELLSTRRYTTRASAFKFLLHFQGGTSTIVPSKETI